MRPRRDAGAATVLVLAAICVLVLATAVVTGLAGAVSTRHRAALAADAAALAAAAAVSGPLAPCETARSLAAANGAELVRCRLDGPVADVTVAAPPPWWGAWLGGIRLNARAGPADI